MPTPNPKPDRLRMFRVMPLKYIMTMANSTLSGMLMATTSVGRISFKNRASTMMANAAPMIMLLRMLLTMMVM